MTTDPQPGMHPEAELLNAFAEQALAAPQRELVLAHLATCPRCRQVVSLALEAAELEPSAPLHAPLQGLRARAPWFRNWQIAWAPVAALAGIVTLAAIVHVRRAQQPAELAAAPQAAPHQQALTEAPAPAAQNRLAAPPPAPTPRQRTAPQKQAAPPSPQSVAIAAFSAQPAAIEPQPQGKLTASSKVPENPHAPTYYSAEEAAWQQQPATISAEQKQAMPANERQAWRMAAARPTAAAGQDAPPPATAFDAAPHAQPEVHGLYAARVASPAPLPSGKTAISSTSNGRKQIAIDSAGAVFLSDDSGAHWSPVLRQWSGQAVRVTTLPAAGKMAGSSFASEQGNAQPTSPLAPSEVTFEITNDKGQHWSSDNGRLWTPE